MRRSAIQIAVLTIFAIGFVHPAALAQAEQEEQTVEAQGGPITPEALRGDVAILKEAFTSLHPALYRYRSEDDIEEAFDVLEEAFSEEQSLRTAYLALSRFTAEIQCGHTYANFFNQSKDVRETLFERENKLPFTFVFIRDRMIVTNSAVGDQLKRGDEIVAINGAPVRDIQRALLEHTKGDGARRDARLYDLQITGNGRYEPFDVYFPLLFPPVFGRYDLTLANGRKLFVGAVTAGRRQWRLRTVGAQVSDNPDDAWKLDIYDDKTAVLKAGSFVTWKMELDWQAFIKDAFQRIKTEGVQGLVLDLRGNGGGDPKVPAALLAEIATTAFEAPAQQEILQVQSVPEDLRPYLGTWDPGFYEWKDKTTPLADGRFVLTGEDRTNASVPANPDAYAGKVVMLVDRAASSATFTMAKMLKETGRATLVGETTGGNQRGITGGAILFLNLPGSGLEVDLPIIGYFPEGDQPDAGIDPDVFVTITKKDIRDGTDSMLEKAREIARLP